MRDEYFFRRIFLVLVHFSFADFVSQTKDRKAKENEKYHGDDKQQANASHAYEYAVFQLAFAVS